MSNDHQSAEDSPFSERWRQGMRDLLTERGVPDVDEGVAQLEAGMQEVLAQFLKDMQAHKEAT